MRRLSTEHRNLIRRYLVWCYKTTKEELDRIERKFTQLKVDYYLLKRLTKCKRQSARVTQSPSYLRLIDEFEEYIRKKEKDAFETKFLKGKKLILNPQYVYLRDRLWAVENAIAFFLGKRELSRITLLYETEMTQRILEAREHT